MTSLVIHIMLFTGLFLNSQSFFSTHFVGLSKDDIKQVMLTSYKPFKINTVNTNTAYNYLKYEDQVNEITVLFFLDKENKCSMVRLMSDYSNINDVIVELNSNFKKRDKSSWVYTSSGKEYSVNLEEGDWFFTVTIKEKKNE